MLPRVIVIVSCLLLAGSLVGLGDSAAPVCSDQSYEAKSSTYAPAPSPVLTAHEKDGRHHYYYLGPPTLSDDMTNLILPLTEWTESNSVQGLQVVGCTDNGSTHVHGTDTEEATLLS